MTISEAREWLRGAADKTMTPGVREAYRTILKELDKNSCQDERMDKETAIRLLRFELGERYPDLPGFRELREAMQLAIDTLERTKWIPVADRMPSERTLVLCSDGHFLFVGMLREDTWLIDGQIRNIQPTYWMSLPGLPPAK